MLINSNEYMDLVNEIKQQIQSAQYRAALEVNTELVMLYHNIGSEINKHKVWGNKYIDSLSADLRMDFPGVKGYSVRNLKYMSKFAELFSEEEIVQEALAQITWYHHVTLMDKVKDHDQYIVLLAALCANGKEGTTPVKIITATEEKSITAEYLLSYILPLFAFDFTQWSQVILFLIFYLTLGFLCIRHNYFSINIILEIANFRFYTCMVENEDGKNKEQRILSHRRLNGCIGETLYLKSLNNEYKLDVQQ